MNDGSKDSTSQIASSFYGVKVIDIPHGGAARYDMVVLVDADAILENGWFVKMMSSFDAPTVGAQKIGVRGIWLRSSP